MNKAFKKFTTAVLAAAMGVINCACGTSGIAATRNADNGAKDTDKKASEVVMTKVEKEYYAMLENPETFPVNFVYDNKYYAGFPKKHFQVIEKTEEKVDGGTKTTAVFNFCGELDVTLVSAVYPEYSAFDYTVYFENKGKTDSGVIKQVNAADIALDCDGARLKGIYGDYDYHYLPYDFDLSEKAVGFKSTRGRACHTYFPYFNLEAKGNGTLLAIGWDGTWEANFEFDKAAGKAHYTGTGTVDMCTYLKPGEKIRTPLMAFVRYYDADEDTAMNMWRKWFVDCNMPYEDGTRTQKVQPHDSVLAIYDTHNLNGADGSITEDRNTWYPSFSRFYENGGTADFRWLDAGWYSDPYGNTVPEDWWGTVGTWEFDEVKWGDGAIEENTEYCEKHGSRTLLWFEPERVTHLDGMVRNYGYDRSWVLSDAGNNNAYLHNLGIPAARQWVLGRIISAMEKSGASFYREDFNMDPGHFWSVGDGYQGKDRKGITENLYMQGHYLLWDELLEYFADTGKCTYIDSCASGGGRNSLESMRRSLPLNRSDSDRTSAALRLAITQTLTRWLPYSTGQGKEGTVQIGPGVCDTYVLRTANLPFIQYYIDDNFDYDLLKKYKKERAEYEKYFCKDFYNLTPYRGENCTTEWTAYMYFDDEIDSGVITAVRPVDCDIEEISLSVKGVNPNKYYRVRDVDGKLDIAKVKGSALIKGLRVRADDPRTALILYVESL